MTNHLISGKISKSLALLDLAIQELDPFMVVGLMSGGDDSLPACYVASLHPRFSGILHVNTGIGIEDTRKHVRSLCEAQSWKLWEYKAEENCFADGRPNPMIYEDLVMKYGFPGPSGHGFMYVKLKERQLRRFERDMGASGRGKEKKRILYVSGVRTQESSRRKRTTKVLQIFPRYIFSAPIHDWDREDCGHAREFANLPRNPVSERLGKSGECLCGAFAKEGELSEIKFWYPAMAARIEALQEKVNATFPWKWEERPPRACKLKGADPESQILCMNCNKVGNGQST